MPAEDKYHKTRSEIPDHRCDQDEERYTKTKAERDKCTERRQRETKMGQRQKEAKTEDLNS
jgi:hypothetical protein